MTSPCGPFGRTWRGRELTFIVGSPRSGTTLLESLLGHHPDIHDWYEPYFIWDYPLKAKPDDGRRAEDYSPNARDFIRREFAYVLRKSRAKALVDKSPENSFKIPAIRAIFPDATFIHLIRDGRDVAASIAREWDKRRDTVKSTSLVQTFGLARAMLSRQPYLRHKWLALRFELRGRAIGRLRNKAKWSGAAGWGPQFPEWPSMLERDGFPRFYGHQWAQSVMAAEAAFESLPKDQVHRLRYEDLICEPRVHLSKLFGFIGVNYDSLVLDRLPLGNVRADNTGGWREAFTSSELDDLMPVIAETLQTLGYEP